MKLILKEDGAEMIRVNTTHVCECVSVSLSSCCVMHTALLPEINRFTQRVDTTQFEKLTKVGAETSTRRTTQKITLKISWSILPVWLENSFQIEFYSISNKRTLYIQPFSLCLVLVRCYPFTVCWHHFPYLIPTFAHISALFLSSLDHITTFGCGSDHLQRFTNYSCLFGF